MLDLATLDARVRALPAPPRDHGTVRLVVLRLPDERRLRPAELRLDPVEGPVGDRWGLGDAPDLDHQVTVMRHDVADVLTEGGDVAVLGDNLFVDLDTSAANLPPGTELQVGPVRCVVTPAPHTGCHKFAARVGQDGLRLTASGEWRASQLRGVHLRVLQAGVVRAGDPIRVLSRP